MELRNGIGSGLARRCALRVALRLVVVVLACQAAVSSRAQSVPTTEGTDFWVSFMSNYDGTIPDLSLFVSGSRACTGTVASADGSWSQTFVVQPGQVSTIAIPSSFYSPDFGQVSSIGLHVTASRPVSLYASNYCDHTYDIANILPTQTLGSNYIVQSYQGGETFLLLATTNNTVVHLVPTCSTSAFQAGDTVTVTLNRGEAVQYGFGYIFLTEDCSGTRIWTEDCKRLALFMGSSCTDVPSGYGACDHLFEQAVPVEYWGCNFVVTSSLNRTYDLMRVTALWDSTVVNVGTSQVVLNSGETYEQVIASRVDEAVSVSASRPVSVYLYWTGCSYGGEMGDPSFALVAPIEQQMKDVTFATFNTNVSNLHYVNVVAPTSSVGHLELDGSVIPDSLFSTVPLSPEYSYVKLNIPHGSHRLSTTIGGFVGHVYGLGLAESYAYAVGSTLDAVNPIVFVNDIESAYLDSTNNVFCEGDVVHFSAQVVDPSATTVIWDFGGGVSVEGLETDHMFVAEGEYEVMADISRYADCGMTQHYVIPLAIRVLGVPKSDQDTVALCEVDFEWNGIHVVDTGLYELVFPYRGGCDSLARLHVSKVDMDMDFEIESRYDCATNSYTLSPSSFLGGYEWNSMPNVGAVADHAHDSVLTIAADRDYHLTLTQTLPGAATCVGSDSIDIFRGYLLEAVIGGGGGLLRPGDQVVLYDESQFADTRVWYVGGDWSGEGTTLTLDYPDGVDSLVVLLDAQSVQGCHDTAYLTLHSKVDADLWIPNVFTPSQSGNNRFSVQGKYLMDGEIWIYDRTGHLMWYTSDVTAQWDGTSQGQELPQAAYTYLVRYRFSSSPKVWRVRRGTVTLLR